MPNERELSWGSLLATVRARYPELYRSWFAALPDGEFANGELVIRVDDPQQMEFLRDQCRNAFFESVMMLTGRMFPVRFFCPAATAPLATSAPLTLTRAPLSADYTFEQFVVGPSNRLAHAACQAVCNQPGRVYNPLFIHGSSGLGKTHLLQATCLALSRGLPSLEILYVTCESFVNDFVRAIRDGQIEAFHEYVRNCGAIVIDDVQFIANRESSQEELFHTFNALYQYGRQIILSADTPPTEIPTLEERLVSRFTWGLVTKIDPPNRETRHAILAKKAELHGCQAPADVLDYIAERVASNVRSLEGALKGVMLESSASREPITLELAKRLFPSAETSVGRPVQVVEILDAVSKHFGVRVHDLVGRKRSRSISFPRQVGMFLARRLTPLSLEEIGLHFGGRDHTTVMHAERAVSAECKGDPRTAEIIDALTRVLTR
jgi:chromosomal replication initiator protein